MVVLKTEEEEDDDEKGVEAVRVEEGSWVDAEVATAGGTALVGGLGSLQQGQMASEVLLLTRHVGHFQVPADEALNNSLRGTTF